ncbi:MAG: gamma-glutamyl-gamma-aminobutyrate hydrolase family protein [Ktedonobacterales bacterium]
MPQPIIGIPCFAMVRTDTGRPIYASNQAYVQAVVHAGGAPVLIPPLADMQSLAAIRCQLDGLLLTGGSDLDPSLYGEAPTLQCKTSEPERDQLELELARWALDQGLPIFGICRGMQVLNVACGGNLYQDIPVELHSIIDHKPEGKARTHIAHDISIEPESLLARILGDDRAAVNSFHHQSVKRVGQGFSVIAAAEDGVIEAMEMRDVPFVLAVQYHPEELEASDPDNHRLFLAFVDAAAMLKRA